jgi:hypothetical protein
MYDIPLKLCYCGYTRTACERRVFPYDGYNVFALLGRWSLVCGSGYSAPLELDPQQKNARCVRLTATKKLATHRVATIHDSAEV